VFGLLEMAPAGSDTRLNAVLWVAAAVTAGRARNDDRPVFAFSTMDRVWRTSIAFNSSPGMGGDTENTEDRLLNSVKMLAHASE
jgi:hypothetical protein